MGTRTVKGTVTETLFAGTDGQQGAPGHVRAAGSHSVALTGNQYKSRIYLNKGMVRHALFESHT